MKLLIIALVLMLIVADVTSYSGGLMCLGKAMCKNKNSGRKKNAAWNSRSSGLWKGPNGPDGGFINFRPWYKRDAGKRNYGFFKTRYYIGNVVVQTPFAQSKFL